MRSIRACVATLAALVACAVASQRVDHLVVIPFETRGAAEVRRLLATMGSGHAECAASSMPATCQLMLEFTTVSEFYTHMAGAPTLLNHLGMWAATTGGHASVDKQKLVDGWGEATVFETLDAAGVAWSVYYDKIASALWTSSYARSHPSMAHYQPMFQFVSDAKAGRLAPLTIVEPGHFSAPGREASDQAENHELVLGDQLVQTVYEAVRASPKWQRTAILVTWAGTSEPAAATEGPVAAPHPEEEECTSANAALCTLGARVPLVVMSPWVAKGAVVTIAPSNVRPTRQSVMESASVAATIHHVFHTAGFLTARDAWATPLQWLWEGGGGGAATTFEPGANAEPQLRTDCVAKLSVDRGSLPSVKTGSGGAAVPLTDFQLDILHAVHGMVKYAKTASEVASSLKENGIDTELKAAMLSREAAARHKNWTPEDEATYIKPDKTLKERIAEFIAKKKARLAEKAAKEAAAREAAAAAAAEGGSVDSSADSSSVPAAASVVSSDTTTTTSTVTSVEGRVEATHAMHVETTRNQSMHVKSPRATHHEDL